MVRRLRQVNFLRPAEPKKLNEIMDRPSSSSSSSGQLGIKIPILDRPSEEITWLHRKTVSALLLLVSLINVRLWEILNVLKMVFQIPNFLMLEYFKNRINLRVTQDTFIFLTWWLTWDWSGRWCSKKGKRKERWALSIWIYRRISGFHYNLFVKV